MTLVLLVWLIAVILLQLLAAIVEYNAIRHEVNGANGLILFVAGVLSLGSLPVGGAIIWYLEDWRSALTCVAAVGTGAAILFWGLVKALDSRARASNTRG